MAINRMKVREGIREWCRFRINIGNKRVFVASYTEKSSQASGKEFYGLQHHRKVAQNGSLSNLKLSLPWKNQVLLRKTMEMQGQKSYPYILIWTKPSICSSNTHVLSIHHGPGTVLHARVAMGKIIDMISAAIKFHFGGGNFLKNNK